MPTPRLERERLAAAPQREWGGGGTVMGVGGSRGARAVARGVLPEHVGHAVALHAAQVVRDEHVGARLRRVGGQAAVAEHLLLTVRQRVSWSCATAGSTRLTVAARTASGRTVTMSSALGRNLSTAAIGTSRELGVRGDGRALLVGAPPCIQRGECIGKTKHQAFNAGSILHKD